MTVEAPTTSTGRATILRADARNLPLPDASVDLVVTSPPYYGQRAYQDDGETYDGQLGNEDTPTQFIANLVDCTREWMRVLKPGGSMFVNLGDSYYSAKGAHRGIDKKNPARRFGLRPLDKPGLGFQRKTLLDIPGRYRIACLDDLNLIIRAIIVWNKTNPTPDPTADRVGRTHEEWVHLTKQPRYYAAPRTGPDPGSVWNVASEPLRVPAHLGVKHPAVFPTVFPREFILRWSPPGGVVLDPFGGSGTTALVARAFGRHGISTELSADYCRIATWRVNDPAELAKARRLPPPPKVHDDGQDALDLFSLFSDLDDTAA